MIPPVLAKADGQRNCGERISNRKASLKNPGHFFGFANFSDELRLKNLISVDMVPPIKRWER
jgi:hypothetical protein